MDEMNITPSAQEYLSDLLSNQDDTTGIKIFVSEPGTPRAETCLAFCKKVLDEANVAITPGIDFDQKRGNSTIRFSYARSTKDIIEGAKRIKDFMSKNY